MTSAQFFSASQSWPSKSPLQSCVVPPPRTAWPPGIAPQYSAAPLGIVLRRCDARTPNSRPPCPCSRPRSPRPSPRRCLSVDAEFRPHPWSLARNRSGSSYPHANSHLCPCCRHSDRKRVYLAPFYPSDSSSFLPNWGSIREWGVYCRPSVTLHNYRVIRCEFRTNSSHCSFLLRPLLLPLIDLSPFVSAQTTLLVVPITDTTLLPLSVFCQSLPVVTPLSHLDLATKSEGLLWGVVVGWWCFVGQPSWRSRIMSCNFIFWPYLVFILVRGCYFLISNHRQVVV